MKRLLLLSLVICFCVSWAAAETLRMDYTFDRPSIESVRIEGEEFDVVVMPGAANCGKIGEPSLPGFPARILLPYGTEIESIEVIPGDAEFLGDDYYIQPVPKQYKLSEMPDAVEPPQPNMAIYSQDVAFPISRFESSGVQNFRGYSVVHLKLQPTEYYPVSGELYYFPKLTVVIETKPKSKVADLFRGFPEDEERIRMQVDNPDEAQSYLSAPKSGAKSYDLLIITTSSLAASFQPLKDYHDSTGILTEIHTTTEIGSTTPTAIRDYIRDEYLNEGISYVIIGGDDDIIPAVDLFVAYYTGGSAEYNMPSDFYFACLDGTFNYDGDSYWGEPTDGDGGGDVDLVAEVYVGRAAVGNATEAGRFVTKTLSYVNASGEYLQYVQMVGEHLGFGGVAEYANNYLDELIDGSTNHGYTTTGIPSDVFTIDKLYDYSWPGNDWPQSELTSRINAGRHIINHLGHGDTDYAMKMYNSDVSADLTNTDLCFLYSQTCLAGHFDGTDCFAEYMNIKTNYGAFAVIMNARYGFGEFNSTDGASERYNREFWDAVFNPNEGKAQIGPANHDSKEDNIYRIGDDYMRWCFYEINLFGDPTISFRGVEALAFSYAGGVPEIVQPGMQTLLEVTVSGVGDGVPVSGTGELHYSINSGAYQTVTMTEVLSNQYEAYLPAVLCGDTIEFYVSAEEVTNGTFYDISPLTPHVVIPATGVITVFEDDFETDKGWAISGGQWARGIPTGGGGSYGNADPTSGHDDPNVIGYNLNGDYTNSMPEYHITSPAFDCSGLSDVKLKFWRYLNVEQPSYDHAYIRVSTNGSTWTTVWENGGTITDNAWAEFEYDISDYADNQSTVYIRFTQGVTDGGWTYSGWNIDDLEVNGLECIEYGFMVSTAGLPDWTAGLAYSQQLQAINGTGTLTWSDKYGDLSGTGLTLSTSGVVSGTPTSAGPITFTAEVTDEAYETAEKEFSFTINPAVSVTTTTLPDWTAQHAYSQSISAMGGTGTLTITDKYGDLSGTGLALATDGSLTGAANTGGTITFTAMATDGLGATGEQELQILFNDALTITTETMPTARISTAYSAQLEKTGGTGSVGWSEIGANLSTYGMMLRTTGQVTGTPTTSGEVTFTARVMDALGASTTKQLTLTIAPVLNITTTTVPDWTIGVPYSAQLAVEGAIGAITWTDKNNDLDGTGLTLAATGLLTGTATATGPISFTAVATDIDAKYDEQVLSFTIYPAPVITTISLPDWTLNVPYSYQISVSGGTGTKTWIDKNGDLAGTGLAMASNGILAGTPTQLGPITFTAQVTDIAGASNEREFTLTINDVVTITTESPIPAGEQGEAYSTTLEATGGTGSKTWTDKNGNLASTGLTLSSAGLLSGTPTVYGDLNFTAVATDAVGGKAEKAMTLSLAQALTITTADVPDWTMNIPYSQQLVAAGGSGEKSWSDKNAELVGTGLTLSSAGLLEGTPTATGEITFTAMVADDKSTIEKPFTFTINPSVTIMTETLPEGHLDSSYTMQLEVQGGTGVKTWSDRDDVLTAYGLTLNSEGLISGTATAGGLIEFVATASDVCGCTDEKTLTLKINLPYVCGDANGDGSVNIGDAVSLINFIFSGGPAPEPEEAGDANGDGSVNIGDAVSLINYIFNGGAEPACQ
ncbi:MAG: C25 family cysteine peptidase [Candidatus Zixiibacteriota bacterium]